jgi:hypothetical protein
MEMLELDPDGMPLSLGAGTPAGEEAATEAPATHVAGDTLEASDAGDADEDHDDDEFEGDDEDDEDDDDDEEVEGDDVDDESGGDDESERPSASFAKRPSR